MQINAAKFTLVQCKSQLGYFVSLENSYPVSYQNVSTGQYCHFRMSLFHNNLEFNLNLSVTEKNNGLWNNNWGFAETAFILRLPMHLVLQVII